VDGQYRLVESSRKTSTACEEQATRMRTPIVNLLAAALLLFGASTASAFALNMRVSPRSVQPSTPLAPSSLVIVDIYLDADPGLGFLSVAVVFGDNGTLVYERDMSFNPSYLLFAPAAGTSPSTYLIPNAHQRPVLGAVSISLRARGLMVLSS
jgi:hypothetical protein